MNINPISWYVTFGGEVVVSFKPACAMTMIFLTVKRMSRLVYDRPWPDVMSVVMPDNLGQ